MIILKTMLCTTIAFSPSLAMEKSKKTINTQINTATGPLPITTITMYECDGTSNTRIGYLQYSVKSNASALMAHEQLGLKKWLGKNDVKCFYIGEIGSFDIEKNTDPDNKLLKMLFETALTHMRNHSTPYKLCKAEWSTDSKEQRKFFKKHFKVIRVLKEYPNLAEDADADKLFLQKSPLLHINL